MAEVFAIDEDRVVKLDRPEWSGVSTFEAAVITQLEKAGLPLARSHGVTTIDGRCGVVLDRVDGHSLLRVVTDSEDRGVDELADRFASLQLTINSAVVAGLPDLTVRLKSEIGQSGLAPALVTELTELLNRLDDGTRGVCHYDFHPDNVIVTAAGWIVIDWLGVATGPPVADLARTLLLVAQNTHPRLLEFSRRFRTHSLRKRGLVESTCEAWIRVAAGARLAEGFSGEYAGWLQAVAAGRDTLSY